MFKAVTQPPIPVRQPAVPSPRQEAQAPPSYSSTLTKIFANLVWLR